MRWTLAVAWWLAATISPASAQRPVTPPRVWGIVIGIDAYDDPAIPSCRGAVTDARTLKRWLVETAGWESSNVLLMDELSPRGHGTKEQQIEALRPTRENLEWAVKEWLAHRVRPGDLVLISFGGQSIGGRDGDPASRSQLLPIDARSESIDQSGWPIQDSIDAIASRGENAILIWLDTSLAGRGGPAADLIGRRTSSKPFLSEITRWPGVSAWIAADGVPSSQPPRPGERGAFLDAVLPAMGTADQPGNLLGGLVAADRDPRLSAQHFQTEGGLGPEWSLWPKSLAAIVRPPSELLLQHGHADRITAVVFSPDDSTMITSSMDSTIKVWRKNDRTLLRTLNAHTAGVTSLALSTDGSKLASGDGMGRVVLWSLPSFRPSRFLGRPPHDRGIASLAFRGDGQVFCSLDDAGTAIAWTITPEGITPAPIAETATAVAASDELIALANRPQPEQLSITLHEKNGRTRSVDAMGGVIVSRNLALLGDRLAVGNKAGVFGVWNHRSGNILGRVHLPDPIECVAISSAGAFAISGETVVMLPSEVGVPTITIPTEGPLGSIAVSADGLTLTGRTRTGRPLAWDLSDPQRPRRVVAESKPDDAPSTVLVVSPKKHLVSGDQDGGIRIWDWPGGRLSARIEPHRGKIETLALSPDGRHLAQIDHDRRARLWDLREGRDLITIQGTWNSLAFFPDGERLAMTRHDGSIVVVDRVTTKVKDTQFEIPKDEQGRASSWGYSAVAVSPDGTMIAAGSPQGPLAGVWKVESGALLKTIRGHDDRIMRVGFTDDSRNVVTASLDGSVKIWPVDGDQAPTILQSIQPEESADDPGVTSVALSPGKLKRAATGHLDGRVRLWDIADGAATSKEIGRFEGPVKDLVITPDGKNLVACGEDKSVRLWRIDGENLPPNPVRFVPQHNEQVNALVAWPDSRLIASASDDSTIRLWQADGKGLVGTICVSPTEGHWVAFTPDGQFDSAPGGETKVTYVEGDRVKNLDQSPDDSRVFGLGRKWVDGEVVPGRSALLVKRPPPLWLAPEEVARNGEVDLKLKLAEADLVDFRLYLNDKPVRDASDFRPTADPSIKVVSVSLARGQNRLVAMATRPVEGSIHGRSNEVVLNAPMGDGDEEGVVHSIALGISEYRLNALKYADLDADKFAGFLAKNGIRHGGRKGMKILLRNGEVTSAAVEKAFFLLRGQVKPEDTVVVFLAGHTDVRRDRFCLLLPDYPFEKDLVRDDPSTLMPYSTIYRNLARMNAQHRLVVIDACQADAVYDDPTVRRIQDKVDDGAHRARTSYLLTTRRGEAAESTILGHGLITHLLLRGMGETDLVEEPGGKLGNADANDDGQVSTDELRIYLDTHLPVLMTQVDLSGLRSNPSAAPREIVQKARAQNSTTPFPLVKLPR